MNIYIYDKTFSLISIVEDRYISCFWSEGYNTIEDFCIELAATEELKKKIRPDCFAVRQDRKTVCVIKTVESDDKRIVATGKTAARNLDDVAFVGTKEADDAYISRFLNRIYKKSDFTFSEDSTAGEYWYQISNTSVLNMLTTMCRGSDTGFKCTNYGGGFPIGVRLYRPLTNKNIVFSKSFGNVGDIAATFSTENYKNVAYVLGEGQGENRTVVTVDLSGGGDRYEMIIDARDLQKEEGESDSDYRTRLSTRGIEKLNEKQQVLKCAFTVLSSEFGKSFDLGDILTVNLTDYGLQLQARVTRFTEKNQGNMNKITIDVGTILIRRI